MPTENYSLRLDPERRGKLQAIARNQDRDLAYVIRKAIDEYIERHQDEADRNRRKGAVNDFLDHGMKGKASGTTGSS